MEEEPSERATEEVGVEDAVSAVASDLTPTVPLTEEGTVKQPSFESIQPLNVYQMRPPLIYKFKANPVKDVIRTVLDSTLGGQTYSSTDAKTWTIQISNNINEKIKELKMKRYKHVVQVIIGEMKGAGVKCGVRCLWDSETDGYTSETFINDTIFSVVAVFAIYLY